MLDICSINCPINVYKIQQDYNIINIKNYLFSKLILYAYISSMEPWKVMKRDKGVKMKKECTVYETWQGGKNEKKECTCYETWQGGVVGWD